MRVVSKYLHPPDTSDFIILPVFTRVAQEGQKKERITEP